MARPGGGVSLLIRKGSLGEPQSSPSHSHFSLFIFLSHSRFTISSPRTLLPSFGVCVSVWVCACMLPLPWHQCDMALNGLCHVKQAPSVNYLAKALAFLEQFIPTWAEADPACVCVCVCETSCVNVHASAWAPLYCSNPLKLNQIWALLSKKASVLLSLSAQMQQAEARGEVLTKSQRSSKAAGYSRSEGAAAVHFLNNPAFLLHSYVD